MPEISPERSRYDDPRRLRDLLGKACDLASAHALGSVVVGLAGFEGDVEFPEIIDYVESALRVDDSLFRMTRERAVVLLTELLNDFRENFPSTTLPAISIGYYAVTPGGDFASAKRVLPQIFSVPPQLH